MHSQSHPATSTLAYRYLQCIGRVDRVVVALLVLLLCRHSCRLHVHSRVAVSPRSLAALVHVLDAWCMFPVSSASNLSIAGIT